MGKNNKKRTKQKSTVSKPNDLISVLFLALIIAIIVMIIALSNPKEADPPEFSPPPFDVNAVKGAPDVSEEKGYDIISNSQMPYSAGLCGKVYIYGRKADIYFTNPSSNDVWMKLRAFDSDGNIIGETGLIKPGEYIKDMILDPTPQNGDSITLKIMTYEPDTYKSEGTFSLTPMVIRLNDVNN